MDSIIYACGKWCAIFWGDELQNNRIKSTKTDMKVLPYTWYFILYNRAAANDGYKKKTKATKQDKKKTVD